MTTTEKQMLALLERRQEIDRKTDPGFTENIRWLLEATELLLRHQLTRSIIASAEFRKVLCEELRKELRNAGILR
jgi:CRISPR/Cas system CSM-associated protein Csm2 small subunit